MGRNRLKREEDGNRWENMRRHGKTLESMVEMLGKSRGMLRTYGKMRDKVLRIIGFHRYVMAMQCDNDRKYGI